MHRIDHRPGLCRRQQGELRPHLAEISPQGLARGEGRPIFCERKRLVTASTIRFGGKFNAHVSIVMSV